MDLWALNSNPYHFPMFMVLKMLMNNGIPELFIGSSNGIHSMNFYDMYTFDGKKQ